MKFYYITFRSVTFAQRGEKVLKKEGIRCTLLRTPRWMEEQGCGYALLPLFSGITELLARCIMAALSGHTHRFLFAIACDPAAWCAAGLYTLAAYLFVLHQWKRQGVLDQ